MPGRTHPARLIAGRILLETTDNQSAILLRAGRGALCLLRQELPPAIDLLRGTLQARSGTATAAGDEPPRLRACCDDQQVTLQAGQGEIVIRAAEIHPLIDALQERIDIEQVLAAYQSDEVQPIGR